MGEHEVSQATEEIARSHGVILIKLDRAMDTIGHNDYVAIANRGGRIVRTGHLHWVLDELSNHGMRVVGVYDQPTDRGEQLEPGATIQRVYALIDQLETTLARLRGASLLLEKHPTAKEFTTQLDYYSDELGQLIHLTRLDLQSEEREL